jgi:hypothetical protein
VSRALRIIGVGIAGFSLLFAALIALVFWEGHRLDTESRAFVDDAVPAIVGHWNFQELERRSTPQFRNRLVASGAVAFPNSVTVLGRLTRYDGSRGQAISAYVFGAGSKTSANYIATAYFQNGRAQFRLTLKEVEGRWLIDGLFIQVHLYAPSVRAETGTRTMG